MMKRLLILMSAFLFAQLPTYAAQYDNYDTNYSTLGLFQGLYVDAEFLYWNTHTDGLQPGFSNTIENHNVPELDFEWNPGFRVGVGKYLSCNEWDLSLTYTWFKTRAHSTNVGSLINNWSATNVAGAVSGRYRLLYERLDLVLRKPICLANSFVLEPTFGLGSAYIQERYGVRTTPTVGVTNFAENHQKFRGVGPIGGINTKWNLFGCWSILGDIGAGMMWGYYTINKGDDLGATSGNMHDSFNSIKTYYQFRLGLDWETSFFGNCGMNWQLAWEQINWVNLNQMIYGPRLINNTLLQKNNDLSLYGVTLRTQIRF